MAKQEKTFDPCDDSIGAWLRERGFNTSEFQGRPLTVTITDDSRGGSRPAPTAAKKTGAAKKGAAKKTAGKAKGRTAATKTASAGSRGARKTRKR